MSISSKFSVGVHILTLLAVSKPEEATSDMLAGSVNTNPVVIRKIMGMLKKAGLVHVQPGVAGASLAKDLSEITLLDVYKAVDVVKENALFNLHTNTNPNCVVGRNIEQSLEPILISAQFAMEKVLQHVTIADVVASVEQQETKR